MEPLMKSDIFFFVTTIFIVISGIVWTIAAIYLIKIFRNFSHISTVLKDNVDDMTMELRDMALQVQDSPVFKFLFGRTRRHRPSPHGVHNSHDKADKKDERAAKS